MVVVVVVLVVEVIDVVVVVVVLVVDEEEVVSVGQAVAVAVAKKSADNTIHRYNSFLSIF